MTARDDVLAAIPVGEANKNSSRAIHESMKQWWSIVTVRHILTEFVEDGTAVMVHETIKGRQRNFYYRPSEEDVVYLPEDFRVSDRL